MHTHALLCRTQCTLRVRLFCISQQDTQCTARLTSRPAWSTTGLALSWTSTATPSCKRKSGQDWGLANCNSGGSSAQSLPAGLFADAHSVCKKGPWHGCPRIPGVSQERRLRESSTIEPLALPPTPRTACCVALSHASQLPVVAEGPSRGTWSLDAGHRPGKHTRRLASPTYTSKCQRISTECAGSRVFEDDFHAFEPAVLWILFALGNVITRPV